MNNQYLIALLFLLSCIYAIIEVHVISFLKNNKYLFYLLLLLFILYQILINYTSFYHSDRDVIFTMIYFYGLIYVMLSTSYKLMWKCNDVFINYVLVSMIISTCYSCVYITKYFYIASYIPKSETDYDLLHKFLILILWEGIIHEFAPIFFVSYLTYIAAKAVQKKVIKNEN